MKYLKLLNESSKITLDNIEKVENLFIDWYDDGCMKMWQTSGERSRPSLFDTEFSWPVDRPCTSLECDFDLLKTPGLDESNIAGFPGVDVSKLGYAEKNQDRTGMYANREIIRNTVDLDDLFHRASLYYRSDNKFKFLLFLNENFNVQEKLRSILRKTRGLDYYKLKWSLTFFYNEFYTPPENRPIIAICSAKLHIEPEKVY